MGVATDADRNIRGAKLNIEDAAKLLFKVVVEKCDGSNDIKDEWLAKYREALSGLIEMSAKLG